MAKKKETESVATASTRVLRPRTPTEEAKVEEKAKGKMPVKADVKAKGKMPVKADAKAKGKMPVEADAMAKGKKTVASDNSGESETARKRKAAGGITRVLRSKSAKKGDEVQKQAVEKYSEKAKTHKKSVKGIMPSAGKGSCSLIVDFTRPESTSERATGVATKRQVALQKNMKGKKVVKRNEAEEESDSDENMHSSDMTKKASLTIGSPKSKRSLPAKKEVSLTIGSPKPKKTLPTKKESSLTVGSSKPKGNLSAEPSKINTRGVGKSKDAPSKEHADDTTAVASSSQTVPKQVSKAEKKRGGVQASTPGRKNPARKARADAKTNK